ncbi:MAG: DUF4194 domain-containing protein [Candidatus Nanopelagicales bacterium]|nr:MAG: DUF4194 domain-containing protein [Actinomycetota bacterium]
MNSSDDEISNEDEWLSVDDDGTTALFTGDCGELTFEQRATLVQILKRTYISAANNPNDWRTLVQSESLLRSRLNDMFLELVVNPRYGIAFKRQAKSDDGTSFPTLLRDTAYTKEETVLLVYLRMRYRSEQASGAETVFVDRVAMLDEVSSFRPEHATNVAGDTRKTENAIDNLIKWRVLRPTSDPERLQISSAIEVLLPVERVTELVEWLMDATGAEYSDHETTSSGGDDD